MYWGRRVRGFRPPCHVFQPWENSHLMVVAVQGALLSCDLQQVVVVHETNKGLRREVRGAYIWWGTPYGGRHGL